MIKSLSMVAALTMLVGCVSGAPETYRAADTHSSVAAHGTGYRSEKSDSDVERVRLATERFLDLDVAVAEGWSDQYPSGCAESPEGAQAYHYLNRALVDGSVDLLRPELLMYEPQEDGSMELVGVDYIIPFDQWPSDEPPTLLGHALARNEPLEVWAIHIWAWRDNPNGVFAPWNPAVTCAYAG